MNNIYSSRKIETACRRDINFMWLLAGTPAPDHSTIARFRKNYLAERTYYIKPQTYEKWKKRSFKEDISKRENMS